MYSKFCKLLFFIFILILIACICVGCERVSMNSNFQYHYADNADDVIEGYVNYHICEGANDDADVIIIIYDGYKYTNRYDMKTILEYIITTPKGVSLGLSLADVDYYISEWCSHNIAYTNPNVAGTVTGDSVDIVQKRSKDVHLNTDDSYRELYEKLYDVLYWGTTVEEDEFIIRDFL